MHLVKSWEPNHTLDSVSAYEKAKLEAARLVLETVTTEIPNFSTINYLQIVQGMVKHLDHVLTTRITEIEDELARLAAVPEPIVAQQTTLEQQILQILTQLGLTQAPPVPQPSAEVVSLPVQQAVVEVPKKEVPTWRVKITDDKGVVLTDTSSNRSNMEVARRFKQVGLLSEATTGALMATFQIDVTKWDKADKAPRKIRCAHPNKRLYVAEFTPATMLVKDTPKKAGEVGEISQV